MLVECGYVRAATSKGAEFTFRPSLARIAALGHPTEIVALYVALHGPRAAEEARYVLASLCEQDDPTHLIGWRDEDGEHPGAMPPAEQIIIALHLMHHGIIGSANPEKPGDVGGYSTEFNAAEFVAAARVHLGLSSADAEALSMTELQQMLRMKFPEAYKPERDVPSKAEYDAFMSRVMERRKSSDQ